MRYFLTGATGFVGGRLARRLLSDGHQVVTIARDPLKAADLAQLGAQVHPGDVTEPATIAGPMRGADGVFHVAGWYKIGVRDKSPAYKTNVEGTRNVLTAMRDLGIRKGVYTSTLAVNSDTHGRLVDESYRFTGRHLSVYDRTKAAAHEVAEELIAQGLPLVIVMPGLIYGPGDTSSVRTSLIQYLQRRLPIMPGRTAFCWAHVDDIVTGHILAMEHGKPGATYIIAGERYAFADAMKLAQEITGVPAPLTVPPAMVQLTSWLVVPFEPFLPLPESYTSEGLRIVAGKTYIGDNSKARAELGYRPRPLREGLAETLRHEMGRLGMS